MKTQKETKEKLSGKRLAVRILAIVLAALMVIGIAYYTIFMIVQAGKEKAAEKEKEKQEQTNPDGNGNNNTNNNNSNSSDSGINDNTLPDDAADDIF